MAALQVSAFSCIVLVNFVKAVPFSYDPNHTKEGPNFWGQLDRNCDGLRQSPINIDSQMVVYGRPIVIQYMFRNAKLSGTFKNNGHSPSFKVEDDNTYLLTGVPYHERDVYRMFEWHMHFGPSDNEGSEHTIDGKSYAGEIHMVHYNTKYGSYKNALKYSDGRVVVGVFVEAGEVSDRPHIDLFLQRNLPLIQKHGLKSPAHGQTAHVQTSSTAGRAILTKIAPVRFLPYSSDIYTYAGSATTPKCEENIQWILHREPLTLSKKTLQFLRTLEDSNGAQLGTFGNYRPSQQLNGRLIEANFVPQRILRLSPFAIL